MEFNTFFSFSANNDELTLPFPFTSDNEQYQKELIENISKESFQSLSDTRSQAQLTGVNPIKNIDDKQKDEFSKDHTFINLEQSCSITSDSNQQKELNSQKNRKIIQLGKRPVEDQETQSNQIIVNSNLNFSSPNQIQEATTKENEENDRVKIKRIRWSKEETELLQNLVKKFPGEDWDFIAQKLNEARGESTRSSMQCQARIYYLNRQNEVDEEMVKKEDLIFLQVVNQDQNENWELISQKLKEKGVKKKRTVQQLKNHHAYLKSICKFNKESFVPTAFNLPFLNNPSKKQNGVNQMVTLPSLVQTEIQNLEANNQNLSENQLILDSTLLKPEKFESFLMPYTLTLQKESDQSKQAQMEWTQEESRLLLIVAGSIPETESLKFEERWDMIHQTLKGFKVKPECTPDQIRRHYDNLKTRKLQNSVDTAVADPFLLNSIYPTQNNNSNHAIPDITPFHNEFSQLDIQDLNGG